MYAKYVELQGPPVGVMGNTGWEGSAILSAVIRSDCGSELRSLSPIVLVLLQIISGVGLSTGCLGRAPRGLGKLVLTRFSGYKFRATSARRPVDLLHPGHEMSLNALSQPKQ
ncbi:hypothetical protein TNCV_1782231 [Trichonephila clavipes]|nr:hypothetical protein TNCV_1782231 [Trichonephila clavipes]